MLATKLRMGSATLWTPSELTGGGNMMMWYDPSASGALTITSSPDVDSMADQSGNGNTISQSTAASKPHVTTKNGLNCLSFDGSDDVLTATGVTDIGSGGQPWTIVCFMEPTATTANTGAFIYHNSSGGLCLQYSMENNSGTDKIAWRSYLNGYREPTITWSVNQPLIAITSLAASANYSTLVYRYDGTVNSHTGTSASGTFNSGSKDFYMGREVTASTETPMILYEFLLFSTQLSTADMEKMEGYLAWKWAETGLLPSGHPYKTAAPRV